MAPRAPVDSGKGFQSRQGQFMQDLQDCNNIFRSAYAEARQEILKALGSHVFPVLIKLDDDLIALVDGKRSIRPVQIGDYHWLKTLSHIPMALALCARAGVACGSLDVLRRYCSQLREVALSIEADDARAHHLQLLDATLDLLDGWSEDAEKLKLRLESYANRVEPLLEDNLRRAAETELTCLHHTVCELRAAMQKDQWQQIRVVVCGSHQARYREPAKRYFQSLFGESEDVGAAGERRVLYGEGIANESDALLLLAGQMLDRELAERFRPSALALQQDILGLAAESVIDRLLARSIVEH